MELYFKPLACSMATRIALYEAGADITYLEVDEGSKRIPDGRAFKEVNPLGVVPTLRTDEGELLSENAAVLQYVADRFPEAALAPASGWERTKLQQWLCFIGTELHKALFVPLLDPHAPEAVKTYALDKGRSRLDYLDAHLASHDFLLDRFSVADAYLATVLGWAVVTPVTLSVWPNVKAWVDRMYKRPSVARAFNEERAMWVAERQRRAGH